MKFLHFLVLLLGISFVIVSCDSESGDQEEVEVGTENEEQDLVLIKVRLTDNPIELSAVYIDLKQVVAVKGDMLIALETKAGIYNLLDFQNGIDTLITDQGIKVDHIDQLIFRLGDRNSIVTLDGEEYPLILPADQVDYLTIDLDLDVEDLDELDLLLDFDACKSVHRLDTGQWVLEPVLKILTINGVTQAAFDATKIQMIKDELNVTQVGTVVNVEEISLCLYDFKVLRVELSTLDAALDATRSFIVGPDCKLLFKVRHLPLDEIQDQLSVEASTVAQGNELFEIVREYADQDANMIYEFRMLDNGVVQSFILDAQGKLICR